MGKVSETMAEERLQGAALIVRAIDLTIADFEASGREAELAPLRYLRERWSKKAEAERGLGDPLGSEVGLVPLENEDLDGDVGDEADL